LDVLLTMANDGVLAGVAVAELTSGVDLSIEGDHDDVLLVTVTERRTKEEIDRYVEVLRKAVGQ
jgi:glycine cleavage system pyridoxal-binding protein P